MGKASRDKGARRERQIVAEHIALGIWAERVPLSGAMKYQGGGHDVDVYAFGKNETPLIAEVKGRKAFPVWLGGYLGQNDALFLIADRDEPLVVLPWKTWAKLLRKIAA